MAMTVRLDDEQDRILTELATPRGISKNGAVPRAIGAEHRRSVREDQIRHRTAESIEEYTPFLDRLAR